MSTDINIPKALGHRCSFEKSDFACERLARSAGADVERLPSVNIGNLERRMFWRAAPAHP
jgi:hypothetical protein